MKQTAAVDSVAQQALQPLTGGSALADRAAAERALELVRPMLMAALDDQRVGQSGCLHLVIMDPALTPADCDFEQAILCELSLPDRSVWDADYQAYARAKARLSWLTGQDGHLVQSCQPHLLRRGTTTLSGGVARDGIVVAASGAMPCFDEAFAGCVAACLKAVAQQRAAEASARPFL